MGRKEARQKQLMQIILDSGGIPATKYLAEQLGVTERTIQHDLNDILEQIPGAAVEDIHRMLMLRLRERLPEMTDVSLLKLAEFFLSKKTEARIEASGPGQIVVRFDRTLETADGDSDTLQSPQDAEAVSPG